MKNIKINFYVKLNKRSKNFKSILLINIVHLFFFNLINIRYFITVYETMYKNVFFLYTSLQRILVQFFVRLHHKEIKIFYFVGKIWKYFLKPCKAGHWITKFVYFKQFTFSITFIVVIHLRFKSIFRKITYPINLNKLNCKLNKL